MATRIQLRRDTAANWASENPILAEGEIGIDLTNNAFKIGDALTAWNDLDYNVPNPSVMTDAQVQALAIRIAQFLV